MTTPKYGLPYPAPADPVADGADNIRGLAESVDAAILGVVTAPGGGLTGSAAGPVRAVAGTTVVVTGGAGEGIFQWTMPPGASVLMALIVVPGDTVEPDQVDSYDYHGNYAQFRYYRNLALLANGGVRVNYIAIVA